MKKYLVAALLLGLVYPAHAASLSGRLFYTPVQRAQIETARQRPASAPADAPKPGAQDTTYNGYVIRSDGSATLWVNGMPHRLPHAPRAPGTLKLPAIPALKPGQQYSPRHGRVLESYERPLTAPPAPIPAPPRPALRSPPPDEGEVPADTPRDGDSTPPPAASER